jgi:hypothetical protein
VRQLSESVPAHLLQLVREVEIRETLRYAKLEWVDWFNHRRPPESIGNIQPAKAKSSDYAAFRAGF